MPKCQFVDPKVVRKKETLTLNALPMNHYQNTMQDVLEDFSKEDLIHLYRDMLYIREYENMLFSLRTTQNYLGETYKYTGPAHLYTGEEAVAVGQAHALDTKDYSFGSHRSHGEIIARGLAAIERLSEGDLKEIMEAYFEGVIYDVSKDTSKSIREQAIDFLFYGMTAELFGRVTGFQKGLGNSMHAFFTPFGIYPNNAIVGGSAPIAAGAALYKRVNQEAGICVANLGDGSLGCGPVWEAMNMAAMDQLTELWEEGRKGGLPVLFNVINNHYGMGGQTNGETMAYKEAVRVASGINPDAMHAERVDGYNVFAVIDATQRKKKVLEEGRGPVLLDVITYRLGGHSTSDNGPYRSKDEVDAWEGIDAIKVYRQELLDHKILDESEIQELESLVTSTLLRNFKLAKDETISPRMNFRTEYDAIEKFMFSNERIEKMSDGEPHTLMAYEENPQVQRLKKKERFAIKDGKEVSKLKTFTVRDALFEAMIDKFHTDPTLIAYGEDNRDWGGAFGVYRGLSEHLPYYRMFNAPISEAAIVGSAVGYAMCGGRAVVELMYCDFMGRAGDEIFNQLAKWQSMSAGILKMPIVLRVSVGSKYGAQHSQDWTALTAHVPGLKVAFPATPYDAKGMLNNALMGSDPVVFFESQKLYDKGEYFYEAGVPEEYYEIELGEPDVKRKGEDLTILTIGATLYNAIEAANILEKEHGLSAEVIDARSIVPFNYDVVLESVKKTGRIILASDATERGSMLNDIARNVTEMAFDYLDGPPVVVGAKNWITPCYELEDEYFPQATWMLDAIHEHVLPLKDYTPVHNYSEIEKIRREKYGV